MDAYADLPEWARSAAHAYEARKQYDADLKAIHDERVRARLAEWREIRQLAEERKALRDAYGVAS